MKPVVILVLLVISGGIYCVDVHVTSSEVLRLFQLERRLLTTFGRDVALFDQARQELGVLTPALNLDEDILGTYTTDNF